MLIFSINMESKKLFNNVYKLLITLTIVYEAFVNKFQNINEIE